MGLLIDGQWHDQWYDTEENDGKFKRSEAAFRNWVTADGAPGPSGSGGFKAEKDRYRLYVSLACPWAHRTLIFRALKGLQDFIPVTVVHWLMLENGWEFGQDGDDDPLFGADFLHQIYTHAKADYSGRVTVPVLWDMHQNTIVSNESAEIIRMFNSAFDGLGARPGDLCPAEMLQQIESINARVYSDINNGVYKTGFATRQSVYEENFTALFKALDWVESILSRQPYLCGDTLTEADWRLFTTLIRFDAVYHGHFKCNLKRIADYPHTARYVGALYRHPGVSDTVNFKHIKQHYYESHTMINPNRIVPTGPALEYL